MTVRAGYGVNYNLGAYGSIAQKLAAQPPFAVTSTSLGTAFVPLLVVDPFASVDSCDDDELVRHRPHLRPRRRADLERRRAEGSAAQPDRQPRLHRHEGLEPRHSAGAEPQPRWRPAHRRRAAVPVAVLRRALDAPLAHRARAQAAVARHLVRRRLCLVARLRQRLVFWRRRRHGRAERSGSRGRVGPIELRAPPRGQRRLHDRAAVGHRPALAQQHQPARAALRRLELERRPSSRSPAVPSRRA